MKKRERQLKKLLCAMLSFSLIFGNVPVSAGESGAKAAEQTTEQSADEAVQAVEQSTDETVKFPGGGRVLMQQN